ncbi:MAG: ParA family protein [Deltaproteobacteria bacterium]|nr:ParA family protein [Deltaproteobacteria bacterium]
MGTFDALRQAERRRNERRALEATAAPRRFRVVTIANPKGGVGKTTLTANLAVYLRALREDLPVIVLGLDGQDGLDRTLAPSHAAPAPDLLDALASGDLSRAACLGEFGIEFVPSPPSREALSESLRDAGGLGRRLASRDAEGVVLIDTGSELGAPVRAALAQSDLVILPVRDLESLAQAERLLALGVDRGRFRFALSGLDLRVKFADETRPDVLALLLYELRVRGLAHFATPISRSPAVEALGTTPDGRRRTVLHGAPTSVVHRQLHALAQEVLEALDALPAAPTAPVAEPVAVLPQARGVLQWLRSPSRVTAT